MKVGGCANPECTEYINATHIIVDAPMQAGFLIFLSVFWGFHRALKLFLPCFIYCMFWGVCICCLHVFKACLSSSVSSRFRQDVASTVSDLGKPLINVKASLRIDLELCNLTRIVDFFEVERVFLFCGSSCSFFSFLPTVALYMFSTTLQNTSLFQQRSSVAVCT